MYTKTRRFNEVAHGQYEILVTDHDETYRREERRQYGNSRQYRSRGKNWSRAKVDRTFDKRMRLAYRWLDARDV
jgi:hypothetical protein